MKKNRAFLFALCQVIILTAVVLLPRLFAPIYGAHSVNDSPTLVLMLVSGALLLLDSVWIGVVIRQRKETKWKWLSVWGVCLVVAVFLTLWLGGGDPIPSVWDEFRSPAMWKICMSASGCLFLPCALIAFIDPMWRYHGAS